MTYILPFRPRALAVSLLIGLALFANRSAEAQKAAAVRVYVGTYTGADSKGIYVFEFDTTDGVPGEARLAAETVNPSFLAIDPTQRFLYAVSEVDAFQGQKGGAVSAFKIDAKTGQLAPLSTEPTGGSGPCHLVVDAAGKNVLAANYGGGSVAVLPIGADGRLGPRSGFAQHKGSSVNKDRQKEPHAHSVNLDPTNQFAFVADLGLDKVLVYRFEPSGGTITPNTPAAALLPPGAGPRHFTFHPSGKIAYVINELNSTVNAWTYDPERGVLSPLQAISTLPVGFKGANYPADIHAHRSGKFLYGSNRGHDSIVVYRIDPATGKLTYVENQSNSIKNPRNFSIDPTGTFLLVANQDADSIVVFRIDPTTGALKPTGQSVKVPKPVCIKFGTAVK